MTQTGSIPEGWTEDVQQGLLLPVRHMGCPPLPLWSGTGVMFFVFMLSGMGVFDLVVFAGLFLLWMAFLAGATRSDPHFFRVWWLHRRETSDAKGRGHYPARVTVLEGGLQGPAWD